MASWFPLHTSAIEGHNNCLQFLLTEKFDVDERNSEGQTALHIASKQGNVQSVKILLQFGADTELLSFENKTALDYAKNTQILSLLQGKESIVPSGRTATGHLTGYLWKSSGREKNKAKGWQKRWFILSPVSLSYFKTQKVMIAKNTLAYFQR